MFLVNLLFEQKPTRAFAVSFCTFCAVRAGLKPRRTPAEARATALHILQMRTGTGHVIKTSAAVSRKRIHSLTVSTAYSNLMKLSLAQNFSKQTGRTKIVPWTDIILCPYNRNNNKQYCRPTDHRYIINSKFSI